MVIVVFLVLLALIDLYVGVSNDAVNFLNSAVGAKVSGFRTILLLATAGIMFGALTSNGMMDIARHGIMNPQNFSFHEVITIFLAVMVADVIILDVFNSLGLPTSTTVSMVFELLGGTFALAVVKMAGDASLGFVDLLNTEKALSVIIAIFVSVAIAFAFGIVVQWLSRLMFTFNYRKKRHYTVVIFGAVAFTALAYFIFGSALKSATFITPSVREWVDEHIYMVTAEVFAGSLVLMVLLRMLRINILKLVVLAGTFALAMAFAGNDLVNFVGVPLAGISAYQDFTSSGAASAETYMMTSLMDSARTPFFFLAAAALLMVYALATSKKAHNVIKTSVDLARQDEGDNMFGSSRVARSLVRTTQSIVDGFNRYLPEPVLAWINKRFDKDEIALKDGAAFDEVRAAINIVLAAALIIMGTNYKLPLSTTYVTFMVAMGTSLADRAWSRESAVFRITGVISVIGGWFITAGVAFVVSAIICLIMYYLGLAAMVIFMALVVYRIISSAKKFKEKNKPTKETEVFKLMMRSQDPEIVWDLLGRQFARTQAFVTRFALDEYNHILEGLSKRKVSVLKDCGRKLSEEKELLKKYRKKYLIVMHRIPQDIALERSTWFHLGINSSLQFVYCLRRILDPVEEHIANNFTPIPPELLDEFMPISVKVNDLMRTTEGFISSGRYQGYEAVMANADDLKNELSALRKLNIDRMQQDKDTARLQVSLVYLNLIQETQQLLSVMRHQLRATKKFIAG